MTNLEKLRELTEKLPPLPMVHEAGIARCNMQSGELTAYGVLSEPMAGIAKCVMSHKAESPLHSHDEREWLLVLSGRLTIAAHEKRDSVHHVSVKTEYVLGAGDYYFVDAGVHHQVSSDCGAVFLAISIPRSEVFPDVRRDGG